MHNAQDVVQPSGRWLKCQNPRIIHKYNNFLTQAIKKEEIMQKIAQMYQKEPTKTETSKQEQWELIDQHLTMKKT